MSKLAKALTAAAGNVAGGGLYVEDVFSTYLYEGNGSTQTITNGIDVTGKGGMIWFKERASIGFSNALIDTARGNSSSTNALSISSNTTSSQSSVAAVPTSSGFSLSGPAGAGPVNYNGSTYASWTFRKAEKFFDVVTYTGTGSSQSVSHNLGSIPAVIICKRTDSSSGWAVWHKDAGSGLLLNGTSQSLQPAYGITDSAFNPSYMYDSISPLNAANVSGATYVAYLFASDAGGFGDDGSDSIIKCGSYTGTGSIGLQVDLGFEPQWVLLKAASTSSPWALVDNMRGFLGQNTQVLQANSTSDEFTTGLYNTGSIQCNATGFSVETNDNSSNGSGDNYIYIAIRRPMKTPESGTEVFAPTAYSGTEPTPQYFSTGFTVDFNLYTYRTLSIGTSAWDRLRGGDKYLMTSSTAAEGDISGSSGSQILAQQFERNDGFSVGTGGANASSVIAYSFKRATGFFDVVAYSGNNAVGRTITHNLGVAPELIFIKIRNGGNNWAVYAAPEGNTKSGRLNEGLNFFSGVSAWNSTSPTSSVFTVSGTDSEINASGYNYIAYLFATLAGVSKVGSYTGTAADLNVDCGFSAGARFILIKRTDSTGDWYTWDSARGVVAGNDPYLLLNSTAVEVTSTDYIDPLASGFTVTSSAPAALNASGGTYIFLAIA